MAATGSTMCAAAVALRNQRPTRIVVTLPVAAPETFDEFRIEVDEIVCKLTFWVLPKGTESNDDYTHADE